MAKTAWLSLSFALFRIEASEVLIPLQRGLQELDQASRTSSLRKSKPQVRPQQTYEPADLFMPGRGQLSKDARSLYYQQIRRLKAQNDLIPEQTPYQHATRDRSFVRIVTYNVHNNQELALGAANSTDMNTDLKKIEPDILILQEVPTAMLEMLKKKLSYMNLEITATWSGAETLSNVIATRKVASSDCAQVTFDGSQNKRGYVRCTIDLAKLVQDPLADEYTPLRKVKESRKLVVYGTHLEVHDAPGEPDQYRVDQMRVMMAQAKKDIDNKKLVIIAGDMNATDPKNYEGIVLSDGSKLYDKIKEAYFEYTKKAGRPHYPSAEHAALVRKYFVDCFEKAGIPGPLWTVWTGTRVDRIYVHKTWNLPIAGCYVYYTTESDHLPVIIDFVVT